MSVLRRFLGALLLGATALAIVGLATGRLASVVTDGVSMQPTYAAGDLVVVARADAYHVGDVVAYRDDDRGQVVLHRIIGGDADGFEVRGDNNASTDVVSPSADQLIGRAVLHVPAIGAWIGSPLVLALVAGVLVGAAGLMAAGGRRSRPLAGRGTDVAPADALSRAARWRWWHGALLFAHLAIVAALVVAVAVPPTVVPPPPVPVHAGELSYGLDVPVSDVYPDGRIDTGDTAFLRVVDHVDVTFRYEGDAAAPANARMRAVLEAAGGWSSVTEIAPLTPVEAGGVELHGTIDMVALREMLARVQDATGVTLTTVVLRVEAIVDPVTEPSSMTGPASADASGVAVSPFRHDMSFRFDELGLDLAEASNVTASVDGAVVALTEPVRDEPGEAREVGGVPRSALRWLAVAALLLVAVTVAVWPASRPDAEAAGEPADAGETGSVGGAGPAGGVTGAAEMSARDRGIAGGASAPPTPLVGAEPTTNGRGSPVVVRVAAVELPEVALRVQLADRLDLDEIAVAEGVPVFERHDGWAAVVTDGAVHWWEPDRVAPVVRVLPPSSLRDRAGVPALPTRLRHERAEATPAGDVPDVVAPETVELPRQARVALAAAVTPARRLDPGDLDLDPGDLDLDLDGMSVDPVDPIRRLESEVTVRRAPLFAHTEPGRRRPTRLPIPLPSDDAAVATAGGGTRRHSA